MELGEKLLRARQEAGLSQRQLCGEEITRNMLSQIEHGTARPSMATLQYLAARLGKPVSYFLEEDAVVSPNQQTIVQARDAFDCGDFSAALDALSQYRSPDPVYDREQQLLQTLTLLSLAEAAITEGRFPYARELLDRAAEAPAPYFSDALEHRRLRLLARLPEQNLSVLCAALPSLDEDLLLRTEAALMAKDPGKAARLLDAAEDRTTPRWCFLRGEAHLALREFSAAARHFHGAEAAWPQQSAARLEQCYRELEDFKKAYYYACKQR